MDFSNYTVTTYDNWHLGSRGQRVGIYYAGIDDFDLVLPDFDTDIYTWDESSHGTLQEMMIDMSALSNRDYTSRYTYDSVYGDSWGEWYNPSASVDKTVVVIGDSMAKVVMPFLTLSFTKVRFLAEGSIGLINQGYIDEYEPDIIISLYYVDNVGCREYYDFGDVGSE